MLQRPETLEGMPSLVPDSWHKSQDRHLEKQAAKDLVLCFAKFLGVSALAVAAAAKIEKAQVRLSLETSVL